MKWLGGLLIALVAATGCAASGHAYTRSAEPPPPREEVVEFRTGFFWVHGHWRRDGDDWHWTAGKYERERAGQVWSEGRWEHRGAAFQWIDGGWRTRGGVVEREPEDHD